MIEDFQNAMRLIRVGRILARHDALFILKEMGMPTGIQWLAKFGSIRRNRKGRKGQRLSRALQEAGPSFIKLGQALSTRSDLFGEEMCDDLSHLQDQIPPFTAPVEPALALASPFRSTSSRTLFRNLFPMARSCIPSLASN